MISSGSKHSTGRLPLLNHLFRHLSQWKVGIPTAPDFQSKMLTRGNWKQKVHVTVSVCGLVAYKHECEGVGMGSCTHMHGQTHKVNEHIHTHTATPGCILWTYK